MANNGTILVIWIIIIIIFLRILILCEQDKGEERVQATSRAHTSAGPEEVANCQLEDLLAGGPS